LGTCIGPVIGGLIVSHTTWRWIFYIMLPFCGFGLVAVPFTLTLSPKVETLREKIGRVDWIGGFLFIPSTVSLLIAISWGGTQEPWGSWRTIAPLSAGVGGLLLTGIWETFGAKEPFLKRSLWHCGSAYAAYFGSLVNGFIVKLHLHIPSVILLILVRSTEPCITFPSTSSP
jgi:MFS family permease